MSALTEQAAKAATVKSERRQLYTRDGKPLPLEGGPYGLAYDADGLPTPDWELEEDGTGGAGAGDGLATAPDGRRRGARIVGAVDVKDYLHLVKDRQLPPWGKRFGLVRKEGVGHFGSYTVADARRCVAGEDFGFVLGDDAARAPTPPLLRLCYGELESDDGGVGAPESVRLFVGLSEIHLVRDTPLREIHQMLWQLGYVCYNEHDASHAEAERDWGVGVDAYPSKVGCGLPGGEGPMFYSWYYRLPPWMPGLVLEGEDGDYIGGEIALRRKAKEARERGGREAAAEEALAKLKVSARSEAQQRRAAEGAAAAPPPNDEDGGEDDEKE